MGHTPTPSRFGATFTAGGGLGMGGGQAPTVPKKILARCGMLRHAAARCGMLRHAAACFKLLVKGTIIFQKRHRFQKPELLGDHQIHQQKSQ